MREAQLRQRRLTSAVVLTLAAALVPATGFAHHGTETTAGFQAGLLHPWTGLDHMAAMLAAGIWATLMRNRSLPAMLCATVVGIVAGTILGAFPDMLTIAEQITVVSVIVIGLFATLGGQARIPLAASLVAVFCVFHGYVHTAEIPNQGSQLVYSGGFLISMLTLQVLGAVIAASLSRREVLARSAGACFSAVGLAMLLVGQGTFAGLF